MKKNNTTRYLAIFMLALLTVVAIALTVFGGYIFKFVVMDKNFWFDLSSFSLTKQNYIMLFTGYVGGFGFMGLGIGLLIELIGEKNMTRFFDFLNG